MSEFHVRVVKLGPVEKHPNADTLSITQVDGGYPVIFRTGEFEEGQLAVYIPIDSVMPDTEQWAFLKGHRRIKAKKLRGIFSMGMLAPLPDTTGFDVFTFKEFEEGDNVQEEMGIVKYEPPMKSLIMYSDNEADPGFFPKYTDIEGLRKHGNVLIPGEQVVISEKIHGSNARFAFSEGRLWVGSHNHFKKRPEPGDPIDIWWKAAFENDLEEILATEPDIGFYGEVYGRVQDLNYGIGEGVAVRFFDAIDLKTGKYLDFQEFTTICAGRGLDQVPFLHIGPWSDELRSLAEGKSTLGGGSHCREGFVVRPATERFDRRCGRVILKLIGQDYMLRKDS